MSFIKITNKLTSNRTYNRIAAMAISKIKCFYGCRILKHI